MSEAIASQLSAGSGRMVDLTWPQRSILRQNGIGPGGAVWNRLDISNAQGAVNSYNLNQNTGWNANIKGRSGATIGATVPGAPNGVQTSFEPMVIQLAKRADPGAPNLAGLDQWGAYRVWMIAAFVNPAAALGAAVDNGLEVTCVGAVTINDGLILQKGTPGLGFRVYDTNKVELIMRPSQAGAVTRVDLLTAADGYDPTQWHMYEMRFIAARANIEAVCKFFIDGVLKATLTWGPGNIMPETNVNYAGFKTQLCSTGGSGVGFTVDYLGFQASRDELNLL